jgi:succinoglycan biosynthesis transport protein ExoP
MIPEKITPSSLLELALRRRYAIAGSLAVALLVAAGLWATLPRLYRSEATILVQGQELPAAYVEPTITAYDVEDRLRAMIQEILSRARLLEIADEFHLYPDLEARPAEDVVTRMHDDITVELGDKDEPAAKGRWGKKEVTYFRLSFAHRQPETAMKVTARLASLFIEQNQKTRSQQARLATDLLEKELAQTKARLQAQEQMLSAYKQRYMGELPEQLQANLNTLSHLQTELQTNQVALSAAEERALLIRKALADFSQMQIEAQITKNSGSLIPPPTLFSGTPEERLAALKQSLPSLEARYTPKHPNVTKTRNEIARLEAELGRAGGGDKLQPVYDRDLNTQLKVARAQIERLGREQEAVLGKIGFYQRRVEATPKREQELAVLMRDYETTQANYQSLLKKRSEAKMAESAESKQKGEQYRVIDPPNLPQRPFTPRLRLFGIALFLGLGGGLGLAFVLEAADHSFRKLEDLEEYLQLHVLAMIPLVKTERELRRERRRKFLLAAACSAIVLLYAGFIFYVRSRVT